MEKEPTRGVEQVYLNEEIRTKLWKLAEKEGKSRNQIIKEALELYLK